MNYMTIKWPDVANGPGTRVSLFVSGCRNACPGCFNPEAWDFDAGQKLGDETRSTLLERLRDPNCSGLTILGGEPLDTRNADVVGRLCMMAKFTEPAKPVWIYSGYTFEELLRRSKAGESGAYDVLKWTDVLVDGRFEQDLADPSLAFRGSSNQRIIDLAATRRTGYRDIVELDPTRL